MTEAHENPISIFALSQFQTESSPRQKPFRASSTARPTAPVNENTKIAINPILFGSRFCFPWYKRTISMDALRKVVRACVWGRGIMNEKTNK